MLDVRCSMLDAQCSAPRSALTCTPARPHARSPARPHAPARKPPWPSGPPRRRAWVHCIVPPRLCVGRGRPSADRGRTRWAAACFGLGAYAAPPDSDRGASILAEPLHPASSSRCATARHRHRHLHRHLHRHRPSPSPAVVGTRRPRTRVGRLRPTISPHWRFKRIVRGFGAAWSSEERSGGLSGPRHPSFPLLGRLAGLPAFLPS